MDSLSHDEIETLIDLVRKRDHRSARTATPSPRSRSFKNASQMSRTHG